MAAPQKNHGGLEPVVAFVPIIRGENRGCCGSWNAMRLQDENLVLLIVGAA
jgi:hypothetical protein